MTECVEFICDDNLFGFLISDGEGFHAIEHAGDRRVPYFARRGALLEYRRDAGTLEAGGFYDLRDIAFG